MYRLSGLGWEERQRIRTGICVPMSFVPGALHGSLRRPSGGRWVLRSLSPARPLHLSPEPGPPAGGEEPFCPELAAAPQVCAPSSPSLLATCCSVYIESGRSPPTARSGDFSQERARKQVASSPKGREVRSPEKEWTPTGLLRPRLGTGRSGGAAGPARRGGAGRAGGRPVSRAPRPPPPPPWTASAPSRGS